MLNNDTNHKTYECVCCGKSFKNAKAKCDHEYYVRRTKDISQSTATPSTGGEKLAMRLNDFFAPVNQDGQKLTKNALNKLTREDANDKGFASITGREFTP
jgi:hypothetical protein